MPVGDRRCRQQAGLWQGHTRTQLYNGPLDPLKYCLAKKALDDRIAVMKLVAHARNLGPIAQGDVEISPLTVFLGPNGAGKSWLSSAIYGLISVAWRDSSQLQIDGPLLAFLESTLDRLVSDWQSQRQPGIENRIERDLGWEEIISASGGRVTLRASPEILQSYLGISVPDFAGTLEIEFPVIARQVSGVWPALRLKLDEREFNYTAHVQLGSNGGRGVGRQTARVLEDQARRAMAAEIVGLLVLPFARSFYLPVERLAIMGTLESTAERDERAGRGVSDARTALRMGTAMRAGSNWRNIIPNIRTLPRFRARSGRHVEVTGELPTNRQIDEVLASGVRVPMAGAAAGSRALAALELVLSSANDTAELFVIDEPELGLHPQLQLAITELLASIANQGHHVIIATHSPYVVDHLVNLMAGAGLSVDHQNAFARELELKTPDALIHPRDVGVYLFEPGTRPREILNREDGTIDWSTFGRISDRLGMLFNSALELKSHE